MLDIIKARLKSGKRTIPWPKSEQVLPDRFRGLPRIDRSRCSKSCDGCVKTCPTDAIEVGSSGVKIDLGRCIFCGECEKACEHKAISFTTDYKLSQRNRSDLILGEVERARMESLGKEMKKLLGRSLQLRQVSAGGCNACEADVNVLSTIVFDMGRFGIKFVASPRHADGLLITGPVTHNMRLALQKSYDAVPDPKIVIACGACAISGGPYRDCGSVSNGVEGVLPIDLYIPGCPPHPMTTLDGLLRLLGRLG